MGLKRERERRGIPRRADVVRSVVNQVIRQSGSRVTIRRLQEALNIPADAAARIVSRLLNAGILQEVEQGEWSRDAALGS